MTNLLATPASKDLYPSGACLRPITLTLMILAIGSLSQSIVCISCRLLFQHRCLAGGAIGTCSDSPNKSKYGWTLSPCALPMQIDLARFKSS
jgi:hypothetical protein